MIRNTCKPGDNHPPFAKAQVMMHFLPGFDDSTVVCLRKMLSRVLHKITIRRGWARSFPSAAILGLAWCLLAGFGPLAGAAGAPRGWLSWRGPEQSGYSRETGLPDRVSAEETLWRADFPGQSAPVIANTGVRAPMQSFFQGGLAPFGNGTCGVGRIWRFEVRSRARGAGAGASTRRERHKRRREARTRPERPLAASRTTQDRPATGSLPGLFAAQVSTSNAAQALARP